MGSLLYLVIGLAALVGGAELLVRGGGALALVLRIPGLIVALTVIAFGTSAPELAVSVSAALGEAKTEAALANVTGSNIANILLVLGVAALIRPLLVDRQLIQRDLPALLLLQLMVPIMCIDGYIGRFEGAFLILIGVAYNVWLIRVALRSRGRSEESVDLQGADQLADPSWLPGFIPPFLLHLLLIVAGVIVLTGGAQIFVRGAFDAAIMAGLSDRLVGLTVIAIGTSAPELVTAGMCAFRGDTQMAVGNSVGSNILNIALVLGLTAVLQPIEFTDPGTMADLILASVLTIGLFPFVLGSGLIGRVWGGIMVMAYCSYLVFSYYGVFNA